MDPLPLRPQKLEFISCFLRLVFLRIQMDKAQTKIITLSSGAPDLTSNQKLSYCQVKQQVTDAASPL